MSVRLYVGEKYREENMSHATLMYPFWGVILKDTMPYDKIALERHSYAAAGPRFIELVQDIQDADYVLIPHNVWKLKRRNPEKVRMIEREAREAGKLILAENTGDIAPRISDPDYVSLRVSEYRYAIADNEIIVPLPAEDLLESYRDGILEIRTKHDRPSVGFVGWSHLSPLQRFRTFLKELPLYVTEIFEGKRGAEHKGVLFREQALTALAHTTGIDTHLIARKIFGGHTNTIIGSIEENRRTFVDNLFENDYSLCVRGDVNVSYRFYETLAAGRIPLVLDTAWVLPLEDKISYRDFCIYVEWQKLDHIGEILREFHRNVSPERFQEMQRQARQTFEQYLRHDSFLPYLADRLRAYADRYYKKNP
jgi:hypothetical protein